MTEEVNLIGGFYQAKSLPFSAQDTVNWLPVPSKVEGSRSPIKLRGVPGFGEFGDNASQTLLLSGNAPNTIEDAAYSYSYSAFGGTPIYVFSINSGSLPPGLTISSSGVISGTPTTAGTYNFAVLVSDSNSQTATLDDTIVVDASAPDIIIGTFTQTTAVTSFNATLPDGSAEGDIAICMTIANTTDAYYEPSVNAFTALQGGAANSTFGGGFGRCFYTELTALNIINGLELSLQGASPTAGKGAIIMIVVKPSYVYSPMTFADEISGGSLNPPSEPYPFPAPNTLGIATIQLRNIGSISGTPYTQGNASVSSGNFIIGMSYKVEANAGFVDPPAWTVTGTFGGGGCSTIILGVN